MFMQRDVAELMRLMQALRRRRPPGHAFSALAEYELTHSQGQALLTLQFDGPMTISTLAEQVGCSVSACTGIVDRLEELKLARRGPKPGDRRVVMVELSSKGNKLASKAVAVIQAHLSQVLGLLSAEDRKSFLEILRRLIDAVEALSQTKPVS